MRFLPIFLDTAAGVVIVVGSGEPALGKLRLLRAAGAHVRWFSGSADVAEEMLALSAPSPLEISLDDPLEAEWSDAVAVVSAAGDPLDVQIAARARRLRIPVNVVDRPELSTFIFPAIVDRGKNEGRELRPIDDIDRNAQAAGARSDLHVERIASLSLIHI